MAYIAFAKQPGRVTTQARWITPAVAVLALLAMPLSACAQDKEPIMINLDSCDESPLARSRCMIEALLDDLSRTYLLTGGGGISSIDQKATWVYEVSLSQRERVDVITYSFELTDEGLVEIVGKQKSTRSKG